MSYVASAQYNSANSASAVISVPTGTQNGDLMFALLIRNSTAIYPNSVPSGWTEIARNDSGLTSYSTILYYRVASSEPANYTWGYAASDNLAGAIVTYRVAFDPADIIEASSNSHFAGSDNSLEAGGVTTAANGTFLFFFGSLESTSAQTISGVSGGAASWSPDTGMFGDTASDLWSSVWSGTQTTAGGTGTVTALTSVGTSAKFAFLVAVNPDSGEEFTISETLSLSETVTTTRARLFAVSETLSLSETVSALRGIAFSVSESLGLTETVSSLRGRLFSVSEAVSLAEVLAQVALRWNEDSRNASSWTGGTRNEESFTAAGRNNETWTPLDRT